jgi:lipoprotein-anchoring transpeptidase ErfK/SrfK
MLHGRSLAGIDGIIMNDTHSTSTFTRRRLLGAAGAGAATLIMGGCATSRVQTSSVTPPPPPAAPEGYRAMYAEMVDDGFVVPAIPIERVNQEFYRQVVPDPTGERPGTVVVDTSSHHLYLVRENGEALRYGVGLGREGFAWAGRAVIQWKQKWPKWTPPDEMIGRQPELAKYSAANGGMPGGLDNPLGARALYLFQDGEDTLYRLHGSPEWWSIGKSVSSGCVRLMNQDIIDLYDRVPTKTPVLVTALARTV